MNSKYIEAIAVTKPNADRHGVEAWLTSHGFTVTPMRAGMLCAGAATLFESVFSVNVDQAELPLKLTVPPALQNDVVTFEIPKPPTYHC